MQASQEMCPNKRRLEIKSTTAAIGADRAVLETGFCIFWGSMWHRNETSWREDELVTYISKRS